MNKIILVGRLTKDPEIRTIQVVNGEIQVANARLAVNRRFKKDEADFINLTAFGPTASFFEKWLKKGTKIIVEGRVQTGSYTNKEGATIPTFDVIVENVEFAESKGNAEAKPAATVEEAPAEADFSIDDIGDDDELPFDL